MATDFQKLVWAEIDKVSMASTITYKDIAHKIGKPNSARAVANACGPEPGSTN
jgi:methylated-DNA-[protein]-cysteine S-methyltransferase